LYRQIEQTLKNKNVVNYRAVYCFNLSEVSKNYILVN
jgi:hypothetical protein